MKFSRIKNIKHYLIVFLYCLLVTDAKALSPQPRWWASAEYLYWWTQDSSINAPLATQNPSSFAVIGQPGTRVIFGKDSSNDTFNFSAIGGYRITIGGWIDDGYRYGIEGSGFGLSQAKQTFIASSVGVGKPILDVPFISIPSGSENVLVGNRPNTITDSDTFQPYSVELNALYDITDNIKFPLIMTAGFRVLGINENLKLNDAIYNTPGLPVGSTFNVQDKFSTKNIFYGLQIGARTDLPYEKWDFSALAEIAFGINTQQLKVRGETNINNQTIIQPIGLFAEPSNIGTFRENQFAILPELEMKVGYHLNKAIYPFFTYNILYINNIIRASNEIDRRINQSQNPLIGGSGVLTGPAYPAKQFNNTSLWMQGVSIGMEINL